MTRAILLFYLFVHRNLLANCHYCRNIIIHEHCIHHWCWIKTKTWFLQNLREKNVVMLINPIVTVKKKKRQQQKTHKNKTKNTTKTKNKTKRDSRKLLCLLIPISTCMPHFKVSLKRQKGRLLKWAAIYF